MDLNFDKVFSRKNKNQFKCIIMNNYSAELDLVSEDKTNPLENSVLVLTINTDQKYQFVYYFKTKEDFNIVWGNYPWESMIYKDLVKNFPDVSKKYLLEVIAELGYKLFYGFDKNIDSETVNNSRFRN